MAISAVLGSVPIPLGTTPGMARGKGAADGASRVVRLWEMSPSRRHHSSLPAIRTSSTAVPQPEGKKYVTSPKPLPLHGLDLHDGASKSTKSMDELHERTRRALEGASGDPITTLTSIDTIQQSGIGHHFGDEIGALLDRFSNDDNDDLFLTVLRFRLLRHNGWSTSSDVFYKFLGKDGNFKEALKEDVRGILGLYEASSLRAEGEEILSRAMEFSKSSLLQSMPLMELQNHHHIAGALDAPRHLRTPWLEARSYIDEYSRDAKHIPSLLEMAKLNFNNVQLLHQRELAEVSRWWRELGLIDNLSFARDGLMESYLWIVGIFPEPSNSYCRVELTKAIAILHVIDDIFDSYGSLDELILFTDAIKRWDLGAMEQLPNYMKTCYIALYNTTHGTAESIRKKHGLASDITYHLKRTWIDMFDAYLLEAMWFSRSYVPTLDEYLSNAVTTGGTYMALVHTFFLLGKDVSSQTVACMDPYPQLFSHAGRILRLWDDLGTAKEEQERGDVASSIECYMRDKNMHSETEARKAIRQHISSLWLQLNNEYIAPTGLPLSTVNAAFNVSRTAQIIYQHGDDDSVSSVGDHVKSLFFRPIPI